MTEMPPPDLWPDFPDGCFDVVLADPPWAYHGAQDKWGAAAKFYATAEEAALLGLPLRRIMARRSVLFLWATSPKLDVALRCIAGWGLHFRGVAFVWVKTRRDGTPIGAQGVRPSIVKPTAEFVLAASPVAKGRPLPLADEAVCNTVFAPRGAHSEKPAAVADAIERLYPEACRVELFARKVRPGWSAWGAETETGPRQLRRGHGSKDSRRIRDALRREV